MKPRQLADVRMGRPVVGEGTCVPRPLARRLDGRAEANSPWEAFRVGAGEGMVWDHRPVPMQGFRLPEAGPNAPLLKRVVRHPYGMEPDKPIRGLVFDASRPDRKIGALDPAFMVYREAREARRVAAPMPLDHAPAWRPHPFGRARRTTDEGAR